MSLLERAQKDIVDQIGVANIKQASVSQIIAKDSSKDDLAILHEGVATVIPPDKLASYVSKNIDIAKAEIRRASKYCFNDKR